MTTIRQPSTPARSHRGAAWIAFIGSGLLVLFWVLYLSGLLVMGRTDSILAEFEAAFPIADAVLAAVLFSAGTGLWTGRRHGRFCLTAGAGMTLYLGILDLTFYARQGLYAPLTADGAVELIVNLLCIVGGIVGLVVSWRIGRNDHVRHAA
jgi:hypothetical protein